MMTIEWWRWQASRLYAMEWLCCLWTSTFLISSCTRVYWLQTCYTCDTLRLMAMGKRDPTKDNLRGGPCQHHNTTLKVSPAQQWPGQPPQEARNDLAWFQLRPPLDCYVMATVLRPQNTELCPHDDKFRSYVSQWHTSLDTTDQHSDFFMCPLIWKHR